MSKVNMIGTYYETQILLSNCNVLDTNARTTLIHISECPIQKIFIEFLIILTRI